MAKQTVMLPERWVDVYDVLFRRDESRRAMAAAETIEVEVPDAPSGGGQGFKISKTDATNINAVWTQAMASGQPVWAEDANYLPKGMLLIRNAIGFQGAGVARNVGDAIAGSVFRGGFAGSYDWHDQTYRLPFFKGPAGSMLTATMYNFGVVIENGEQDCFHIDGLGNGALIGDENRMGPVRTRGGRCHWVFRSPKSRETGYLGRLTSNFADGYAHAWVEIIAGGVDAAGKPFVVGPSYWEFAGCDVQTENARSGCYIIIKNAQPGANRHVARDCIFHKGALTLIKASNCVDLCLATPSVCLVDTLVEHDEKSNIIWVDGFDPQKVDRGPRTGGYVSKCVRADGSINEARSVRFKV